MKTILNKKVLLCILVSNLFVVFAESKNTVQLQIVSGNGEIVSKEYDKNLDALVLSSPSDAQDTKPQVFAIENLDALTKLKSLTIYFCRGTDYSFISKAKGLQELTLIGCPIESLEFLESMTKLRNVYLEIITTTESAKKLSNTKVNMKKLSSLKEITVIGQPITVTPKFENLQKKASLKM